MGSPKDVHCQKIKSIYNGIGRKFLEKRNDFLIYDKKLCAFPSYKQGKKRGEIFPIFLSVRHASDMKGPFDIISLLL
jgi:hypothetical protein